MTDQKDTTAKFMITIPTSDDLTNAKRFLEVNNASVVTVVGNPSDQRRDEIRAILDFINSANGMEPVVPSQAASSLATGLPIKTSLLTQDVTGTSTIERQSGVPPKPSSGNTPKIG
jgi:hypothetical protein